MVVLRILELDKNSRPLTLLLLPGFTNHVDKVVLMDVTTAKQHRVSLMIWHSLICGACDRWVCLALERDSAAQEAWLYNGGRRVSTVCDMQKGSCRCVQNPFSKCYPRSNMQGAPG